jgi:hypothetical protein
MVIAVPQKLEPCRWGCPETGPSLLSQEPKTGDPAKELSQTQGGSRLAQDCTATAQGCLLTAQVKTASAQV